MRGHWQCGYLSVLAVLAAAVDRHEEALREPTKRERSVGEDWRKISGSTVALMHPPFHGELLSFVQSLHFQSILVDGT
uniref:Putative secreted protein n=1 Tax=Anopheles darlingi TaxID=43151 RepID=A0A2M4DF34_ANODA